MPRKPNVILVGIDSLRVDHMSMYVSFKPLLDIRSDVEYWRNLAREKGIRVD